MPEKVPGLGTLVKVDAAGGTTFVTVACVPELTPPGRSRARIEATCLDDDMEQEVVGIEKVSEFEFRQFWHVGDTNHEILDTLFDSKAEAAFQIVFPYTTPVAKNFPGKVVDLTPSNIVKDGVIGRTVRVLRTGPITTGVVA